MNPFASLQQKRQFLGQAQEDLSAAIQEHLRSNLLEYELAKAAPAISGDLDPTLFRSQAEEMVAAALGLEEDLSSLGPDDLLTLYRVVSDSEEVYRQEPVQPLSAAHQSLDPAIIPNAMGRFFEWVHSSSFGELHPVEQATLSQVRLYEIQPFQEHSHLAVSLFSLYFFLRGGYLIPLYRIKELPDFHRALEQAFALSTEELVGFNARACERSYEYALTNL